MIRRQETEEYQEVKNFIEDLINDCPIDKDDIKYLRGVVESDKISINEITLIFKQRLEELLKWK